MEQASFYLFLLFVFAVTLLGGWIPTVKILSKGTFRLVISFCAGVLLGAVFFHMLPEISTILGDNLGSHHAGVFDDFPYGKIHHGSPLRGR